MERGKKIQSLDILRDAGLIFVVVYHLFPAALRGGFIGVDIFFICSGYLITALLINEYRNTGGIRLADFYMRRLKRLIPSVVGAVLAVLTLSLLISPDFRVGIGKQAISAVCAFTNYYEILSGSSYENQLLPHLFLHTWALAVEIQFYLVWGAVVAGIVWLHRRKRVPGGVSKLVLCASVILGAVSFILMQIYLRNFSEVSDPAHAYFAFETRAYSLLIGAAAACIAGIKVPARLKNIAAIRGFKPAAYAVSALSAAGIVVMAFVLRYNEAETYYFGLALTSGLSALIVVLTRMTDMPVIKGWSGGVIEYLSTRSYGLYLYHWPIYIIMTQLIRSNNIAAPLTLLFSFAAAEASYRLIEKRFRNFSFKKRAHSGKQGLYYDAGAAPRSISSKVRPAVGLVVVVALLGASVFSVASSPLKTSIQADLDAEAEQMAAYVAQNSKPPSQTNPPGSANSEASLSPSASGNTAAGSPETTAEPGYSADTPQPAASDAIGAAQPENTGGAASNTVSSPPAQSAPPGTADSATASASDAADSAAAAETTAPAAQTTAPANADAPADTAGTVTDEPSVTDSVLLIGDSVALGASSAIIKVIPNAVIDAKESRDIRTGLELLSGYADKGELADVIVIALGDNNINRLTQDRLEEVVTDYGEGRKIVFVTGYGNDSMPPITDFLRTLPGKYPNVAVADWAAAITDHLDWLYSDNVHIKSSDGKKLYADLIVQAIEQLDGNAETGDGTETPGAGAAGGTETAPPDDSGDPNSGAAQVPVETLTPGN